MRPRPSIVRRPRAMVNDTPRPAVMVDVARLAGVSHQTVSRVINHNPKVSPEIREKVERAIAQLGYRRNTAARALATRRTMNLGVISVGPTQYGPAHTLIGITEAARARGYATSLISLIDPDRDGMRSALDDLLDISVDGIIIIAPVDAAVSAAAGQDLSVPVVMFQPGDDNGSTIVSLDEVLGSRLAARHLLELGHNTVWHVAGPAGWLGTDARVRGWQAELTSHKRVAHELIRGDWSAASGYKAGLQIADDPDITALFVANDQMALGVIKALADRGRDVPGDVSVVGFDDTPEAAYYQPALTTVRLDFDDVGRRCVDRLMALMSGTSTQESTALPPTLVVRDSARASG